MQSQLTKLLTLQELDSRITSVKKELDRWQDHPQIRSLASERDNYRLRAASSDKALRELQQKIRWLETETEELAGEQERLRQRLYSGRGSAKELEQMQKKIELLKRQQDEKEVETLQLMEETEGQRTRNEKIHDALSRRGRQLEQARGEATRRIGDLREQLAVLEAQRPSRTEGVGAELLKEYGYIRSRIGDPAAVPVVGGVCTACSVTLPIILAGKVKKGQGIHRCENCGRILCWVDEAS